MSGNTQGDRKLATPAPNDMATPTVSATGFSRESGLTWGSEPKAQPTRRAGRLLRWYFALKYRAFRRERRPPDGRRGLIALQIDALAYAELRRAIELGYCPTISRLV